YILSWILLVRTVLRDFPHVSPIIVSNLVKFTKGVGEEDHMKRSLLILSTLFLLLAAACAGAGDGSRGISSNLQPATAVAPTGTSQVVSLADLAAEPQAYQDQLLQV